MINQAALFPGVPAGLTAAVSYVPGDVLTQATYSRASVASYAPQGALIAQATSGTIRDSHYVGATRTTLLEPAATNVCLYGSDFSQRSAWTLAGGSNGVAPSTTAPDGTATACQLVITSVAGSSFSYVQQIPASQPLSPQTFSVWLKGNLGTEVVWLMSTADNVTYQRTQCTLTNTWRRYAVTSGSAGGYSFRIGRDLRDGSQTAQGSAANIFAWGAQIETGSVMSSTIYPTTTSSVTRAADSLVLPGTPVSPTPVAMTVYAQYVDQGLAAQNGTLCSFGNAANRLTFDWTSTPSLRVNLRTASTDHTATNTASIPAFGDTVEVLCSVSGAGACSLQHNKNGSTLTTAGTVTQTLPGAWDTSTIELGGLGGAAQGGLALVGLIICSGVATFARTRSAAKKPIASGADVTPASIVLSPPSITATVGGADVNCTTTVTNAAGSTLTIAQAPVTFTSDATAVFTVNSTTGVVHIVGAGTGTLRAQTSVAGVFDTTPVTVSAAVAPRSMRFPNGARARLIARSPSRDNATDRAFINAHYDDIEDTGGNGTLTGHPNAISVQHYGLLAKLEVDTGSVFTADGFGGGTWNYSHDGIRADGSIPAVTGVEFATAYATANSVNDETMWLHVRTGDQNKFAGITSITAAGAILFNNPLSAGAVTSFPYAVGMSVTLTGLSVGNGVYTIASLQKQGVTLTGWTGGDLNVGGAINTSKIGTLYVPGTGVANYANRKWYYIFSEWRMIPYYGNADARQVAANRFALQIQNAGNPINAVLVDEMDGSIYQQSHVQSMEYPTSGWASSTFDPVICQYTLDINAAFAKIRLDNPGIVLRINTASYAFPNNKSMIVAAGGAHCEQLMDVFHGDTSWLDFWISCVNAGADCEFVDGGNWLTAALNGNVTPVPGVFLTSGSYNAGNYPTASARRQMASYALYLMGMDATQTRADGSTFKHAIIDLSNSNSSDVPISAHWTPAFEYAIGQPTGAYVRNTQITPSVGTNILPLTRTFSLDGGATASAYAVFGHNTGSSNNTNYGDNSLVTVNLPAAPASKAWYLLGQDGSVGTTPLTSVSIRRAEGVVVVAAASGVLAQRADTFVDSIGTNVHMDYDAYAHAIDSIVIPVMLDTGMRNIRSGMFGTGSDAAIASTILIAQQTGSRFTLVSVQGSSFTDMSVQDYMMTHVDPSTVRYIEGPNEVDNNYVQWGGPSQPPWVYGANATTFMNALKAWRDGNANAAVRALPISTPSVTSNFGAVNGADWSSQAAVGTIHFYPEPNEPGAGLAPYLTAVKPMMASLTRFIITETGYNTAPNATQPSFDIGTGVTEAAAAKYMPRLYAEYFKQGSELTCLYELINEANDLTNAEMTFGLVKTDGTHKAAYAPIKNLIAVLSERSFTPPVATIGNGDFVTDTYTRANANGWGTATSGADTLKTWIDGDGAEAAQWQILTNKGQTRVTSQVRNIVGDVKTGVGQEIEIHFQNYRAGYSQAVRAELRHTDVNNTYEFALNGGVSTQLVLTKSLAGVQTTLSSVAKASISTLTSGVIKFRIIPVGTDNYLYCKAWDAGTSEPATWDISFVDKAAGSGTLNAGKCGVWCDNNSSGQFIQFTSFKSSSASVAAGSWPALAPLTLGRLAYTLTGATGNVQDLLLQKADGSYWLLLWQRATSYNTSTKQDIAVAPASVTISTTATHNWLQYTPSAGTSSTVIGSGTNAVTVNVPDELIILKIS